MRILLAPDKFAGTLTAGAASAALAAGWLDVAPSDELVARPMSDGGPGFVDSIAAATGVEPLLVQTTGPHGESLEAPILVVHGERRTVYLEAGTCCGLSLAPGPRRPLEASSGGLVALIEAALDAEAERIIVGVGGTASTDGGRPVVEALSATMPADLDLVVATDVAQPLLGANGAARSFAPQKGASDVEVIALERRLTEWAAGAAVDAGQPGAGAGGGLSYGLMRLGGRRVSGAAIVADAIGLDAQASRSDLVITGEGQLDFSSLRGKVVSFVAGRAQAAARPCVAVVGSSSVGRREAAAAGIDEIYALVDAVGVPSALEQAAASVRLVAGGVARDWSRRPSG
ncbi:MAG: glycerate kinase [Actinomycetia bacterium]|nr:glycerate kinase [Actinomycetes bacterium]